MIRFFLTALAICSWSLIFSQQDSIYNDDPMQLMPLGMQFPQHQHIEAKGAVVTKSRVEPPFWWAGMSDPHLQILIYDQSISDYTVSIEHPGVQLGQVHRVENPNFLFVDVQIGPGALPGKFPIVLTKGKDRKIYNYELKLRNDDKGRNQGLSASDLIYLIMPDRFANGDTHNDSFNDMRQSGIRRDKFHFRHGGDLIGIMEHLDYLKDLGVTTLWINPVLENDEPYDSYHGYAITDHYNVDKRLGTNEQYIQLVKLCHERGMKIIMDVVHNHVGDQHWFIRDLPSEDWIHQFDKNNPIAYRESVKFDPYASQADDLQVSNGWFDAHMPDLNQKNPYLANYLIQNAIWWAEYSGQDGYRIDTYFYNDQAFASEWNRRLKAEFPNIGIFGETWVQGVAPQAFFSQDNHLKEGFNSNLSGLTDFQIYYAIQEALAQPQGWTSGITRLYLTLAQDFLYKNPYNNVLFLDNHDLTRYYTAVNEDINKYKSGIALLLTLRGTPMLYYGTEILINGYGGASEGGRKDFPGGWSDDPVNKFTEKGRTQQEQDAFTFVKTLANYRKNTPALQNGKMMQFIPENGVYVFFRYDNEKTIMVLTNTNNGAVQVPIARYQERMFGFTKAKDVITGAILNDINNIAIDRNSTRVLELKN